jgi:hypothetical protein
MDVGEIVLHVIDGKPLVVRCEAAVKGVSFMPALNADDLVEAARQALADDAISLDCDGLYPCPLELQDAARFAPLQLPADPITLAAAWDILYPDLDPKAGWERVHRAVKAGRLRAYMVGTGREIRRFVSRTQVLELADSQKP